MGVDPVFTVLPFLTSPKAQRVRPLRTSYRLLPATLNEDGCDAPDEAECASTTNDRHDQGDGRPKYAPKGRGVPRRRGPTFWNGRSRTRDLPSNRYPEIAERVRALCEKYDVPNTIGPLYRQYGQVLRTILRLSLPTKSVPPVSDAPGLWRATLEELRTHAGSNCSPTPRPSAPSPSRKPTA